MVAESNHPTGDETDGRITRRGLIRGGAAVAGVGLVGGVGLWHGSQPVFAAELGEKNWEANDASIRTYDGTITGVTLDPEITIRWSGVADEEREVDVEVQVSFPDDEDGSIFNMDLNLLNLVEISIDPDERITIFDERINTDGHYGEKVIECPPNTITEKEEIDKEFFEAPEPGTTNSTPVDLHLIVDPEADEFDRLEETVRFTVSVENVASEMLVEGETEVTVDSDAEYPDDDSDGEVEDD